MEDECIWMYDEYNNSLESVMWPDEAFVFALVDSPNQIYFYADTVSHPNSKD